MILFIVLALVSYLIGALPVGLLVGKLRGVNITEYGSGKIGTTNVLRTIGVWAAVLAFVGDLLKGVIPVLLAKFLLTGSETPLVPSLPKLGEAVYALCAIVGHNWSVYIKFRGGRGVTPGLGALIVMVPWVALVAVGISFLLMGLFRYVSLANVLGMISVPLMILILFLLERQPASYLIYSGVGSALIIFQHRDNIARLLSGTERKLGQRGERRGKEMRE